MRVPEPLTGAKFWRIFKNPKKKKFLLMVQLFKNTQALTHRKSRLCKNWVRCECCAGKFSQSIRCKTPMKQPLAESFKTFFQKGIVSLQVLGLTVLVLTNNAVQSR